MAIHSRRILTWVVTWLAACMVLGSSSSHSLSVQQQLKRLNKPAISTIESPDGDIIDCIPISQQPAFDHPLLKDHKIQMQPEIPGRKIEADQEEERKEAIESSIGRQVWHQVASSCPEGTIPMRHTTERDILRSKSQMHTYGRKFHHPPDPSAISIASNINETVHEHAVGYVPWGTYYGAKANINVWNPSVQVPDEFSLSQIWIIAGSFNSTLNTIEAGWQVFQELYGDNNTRLFIYWTNDSYQKTGCYNLLCSGFVQVSNEIVLGGTIAPMSSYDGLQYEMSIFIWKDCKADNWWMQLDNKYILGYWPGKLFTFLSKSASLINWGGEVVNLELGGKHTRTKMGSGQFPSKGYRKSSYFSHLTLVVANNTLVPSSVVKTLAKRPECYNIKANSSSDWGSYFYYGGPGRSQKCLQ